MLLIIVMIKIKTLLTEFTDYESSSSVEDYITTLSAGQIQVRTVYHGQPSTVYRYYDPYSSINVLSQEFAIRKLSLVKVYFILCLYMLTYYEQVC